MSFRDGLSWNVIQFSELSVIKAGKNEISFLNTTRCTEMLFYRYLSNGKKRVTNAGTIGRGQKALSQFHPVQNDKQEKLRHKNEPAQTKKKLLNKERFIC